VASAGPYASLHLTPDSTPPLKFFTGRMPPPCRPTNSIKALKATELKAITSLQSYSKKVYT